MIITLVALVLLLIAVAAVVRTVDNSTTAIGNLAFRRDLTNRAELAIAKAKAALNSGGALYSDTARSADAVASNYSATQLAAPSGGIGVPAVLVSNTAYNTKGYTCIDGSGATLTGCTMGADGIVIRWVIDRQCLAGATTFDTGYCEYLPEKPDPDGNDHTPNKPKGAARPVFRISVRVTGPRNTEAYIQTTAG